jgi:hypothetical protein
VARHAVSSETRGLEEEGAELRAEGQGQQGELGASGRPGYHSFCRTGVPLGPLQARKPLPVALLICHGLV